VIQIAEESQKQSLDCLMFITQNTAQTVFIEKPLSGLGDYSYFLLLNRHNRATPVRKTASTPSSSSFLSSSTRSSQCYKSTSHTSRQNVPPVRAHTESADLFYIFCAEFWGKAGEFSLGKGFKCGICVKLS